MPHKRRPSSPVQWFQVVVDRSISGGGADPPSVRIKMMFSGNVLILSLQGGDLLEDRLLVRFKALRAPPVLERSQGLTDGRAGHEAARQKIGAGHREMWRGPFRGKPQERPPFAALGWRTRARPIEPHGIAE